MFESRRVPVVMRLSMSNTRARRIFKDMLGQANHFLITVMVGLDAVASGDAHLSEEFSTSWSPKDAEQSAQRSRLFVNSAVSAWLVDSLAAYIRNLTSPPTVITDQNLIAALRGSSSIGSKVGSLASASGQSNASETFLLRVAIIWRNRLVHYKATNPVSDQLSTQLQRHASEIASSYQGLDVDKLLESVGKSQAPHLKEITALIRAAHKFVERVDGRLVAQCNLDDFIFEVLRDYVATDPTQRISNVWGKDAPRRPHSLVQIASKHRMSADNPQASNYVSDHVVQEILMWTPSEARARLTTRTSTDA